jgi:hypothetical protein
MSKITKRADENKLTMVTANHGPVFSIGNGCFITAPDDNHGFAGFF